MELDQLKADWQQQHSTEKRNDGADIKDFKMNNLDTESIEMEKIVATMSALEKEIRNRTIYGVLSFTIVVVSILGFAYFLYLLNMPALAIGGLFIWVFFITLATVILVVLQLQNANHDNALSIEKSLVQKRLRIKSERRFYQTVVWWLLAPMSMGIVMILIATDASLMAASFELVVFAMCMYWAYQNNRRHIANKLKPIEDVLDRNILSLR